MAKTAKARVRAIHSSEPAARDEGPRLIPLRNEPTDVPLGHYLQLADTALRDAQDGKTRKSATKSKKKNSGTLEET